MDTNMTQPLSHGDMAKQSYNNYMLSHYEVAKQKGWVSTADPQVFAHNWKPGNKHAIAGFLSRECGDGGGSDCLSD